MSEQLTVDTFDAQHEAGRLVLSLVGMSNVGKSYISKKLAGAGFMTVGCDDLIGEALETEIGGHEVGHDIEAVARWMGMPHEDRSLENQQKYLELEAEAVQQALQFTTATQMSDGMPRNSVIDTTGSVVHLGQSHQDSLKAQSLMVYIKAPSHCHKDMLEKYMKHPKPVVWGDVYAPRKDEDIKNEVDRAQILMRCYPQLLRIREHKYHSLAHVTLDRCELEGASASDFIEAVRQEVTLLESNVA